MITILISEDEKKTREMLFQLLKNAGYDIPENINGKDGIIKIVGRDEINKNYSLKDKIIELEESLFNEKRGVLYKSVLEEIEKPLIEHILERTEGNQLKAAKILGINRNTMRTKLKKLGIDPSRWKV